MECFCDVCDKTISIKSKRKNFQNLTDNELPGGIRMKHKTQNPDFFDMDSIFHDYITNHDIKLNYISLKMIWN